MKISKVSVEELFGSYSYELQILTDKNITILDAPNGMGKTTVLGMIHAALKQDIDFLDAVPFRRFTIFFDENSNRCRYISGSGEEQELTVSSLSICKNDIYYSIADTISEMRRNPLRSRLFRNEEMEPGMYYMINDQKYPVELDFTTHPFDRVKGAVTGTNGSEERDSINDLVSVRGAEDQLSIIDANTSVCFIEANRLYYTVISKLTNKTVSRVVKYQDDISQAIRAAGTEYAQVSQQLDRTFPQRVLKDIFSSGGEDGLPSTEQLVRELKELDSRRGALSQLGVISDTEVAHFDVPENQDFSRETKIFLCNFIHDSREKISVYSKLAEKLTLLREIINVESGYSDKELHFNQEVGAYFVSTDSGRRIPLSKLSSGEKNNFILFYELIFEVEPGSLVLIDEPEISLHVAWQQKFIDELDGICRLRNLQAVVATHSPDIVSDHIDLLVDLQDVKNG